jgi:amidohydrolase family protein
MRLSNSMRRTLAALALAPALMSQPRAALVLTHGKIWTGNPAQPQTEAADIAKWAGPRTQVVDLAGRRTMPGFNDAHVHFHTGGTHLSQVQLRDAHSEAEFRDRIRQFAAGLPAGRWILGGDWDHESRMNESDLPRLWLPKRENLYQVDALPQLGTGKLDLRGVKMRAQALAGVGA